MTAEPLELPPLPAGYSTRPPVAADAELVLRVLQACELAELGEAEVDLEDIVADWRRPGYDISGSGVFVLDDAGEPVGYGELMSGRAEGNVVPGHQGRGIGTWIAAWIRRRALATGDPFVRQVVPANAGHRLELLRRADYEVSDTAWALEIALPAIYARPALPPGVELRDLRPGIDDAAAFQVVEDAFAEWPNRQPNTLDSWRALTIDRAGFEPWMLPMLWVDGAPVGVAYCIDYPDDAFAWIQQLAVRADRRGRGLGAELLYEVFSRFAARGRTKVGLSTDSRTGALELYERVGMRVIREFTGHVLHPGASPGD